MLALVSVVGVSTVQAESLDAALLPKIQAATFEVVQAKTANDPTVYEKPLPLDLLPYQERTDKYHSIGTAFAIGHGQYVTAGHVLLVGANSLWGPPELRDSAGHVYPIAKVEKFSLRQDFVVFTLAQQPAGDAALEIDRTPALNQAVYAVGNALGTGVVIRDGLYTSDTPEEQDGAWKWMRFSAAASPGNSGGPLLDKDGKVIGVVLMKSANENLNYALPISGVLDAPDNTAVIDRRVPYQFDLFDTTNSDTFKARFALPMSLGDFFARYEKLQGDYVDGQLKILLAKEPDKVFPNGSGSNRLLHSTVRMSSTPALIDRGSTGIWSPASGQGRQFPLANNGFASMHLAGANILFLLRKPDDVAAAQLYGDPQKLMDMLLKTGFIHRTIGTEQIRATSLGKPLLDASHTDRWQRRWQVFAWPVSFANAEVMVLALPVPEGYVGIMRILPASEQHDFQINLEAMTDFFDVAYRGSLAQWQDYLKNSALLPAAFTDIKLGIDIGHRFSYTSPRVSFSFTPELQQIATDSQLTLGFGFLSDHGKVAWDVGDVQVSDHADGHAIVNVQRDVAPSGDLEDDFKTRWNKIVQQKHPFDGVSRVDDDVTKITAVAGTPAANPTVIWTAFYSLEGSQPQADMKAKLDLLMKNLQVTEH
ncbi:serine protease [Rhodanobacter sp. DHG33]|uniref:S1 family peptidase n=1 Tax=Rhodanobacter sp. DHG33 TaxID=2775921 RepID=UPI001CE0EEF7|nr:serine protease [Rhodanobacter sp. DHG33]